MYVIPSQVYSEADAILGLYRSCRLELAKVSGSFPLHSKLCQALTRGHCTGEGGLILLCTKAFIHARNRTSMLTVLLLAIHFFMNLFQPKQTLKEKARWPLLFWVACHHKFIVCLASVRLNCIIVLIWYCVS